MGKAIHRFPISLMQATSSKVEDIVSDRKALLLSILPIGSELVDETYNMSSISTTINYSLTIEHSFFPDDSEVEIDTIRICWRNESGIGFPIGTDSIVTSIRYLDKEGKSFLPT